jgi:L-serine dehydratase
MEIKEINNLPASILNNVIGPVMRGPSSSHVAGAERIASIVRQSLNGDIKKIQVDFDINGSLASSYHGHGSDIGFASGILGLNLTDKLLPQSCKIAKKKGIEIEYRVLDYGAKHPNNYRIFATSENGKFVHWQAVSVGGGMIKMESYNDFEVSIIGDYYELLLTIETVSCPLEDTINKVKQLVSRYEYITISSRERKTLLNVKMREKLDKNVILSLNNLKHVTEVQFLNPILPILSSFDCKIPFRTVNQLLKWCNNNQNKELWEIAALYEAKRGNCTIDKILENVSNIVYIMEKSIKEGLAGTKYSDRILGPQAYKIDEGLNKNLIIPCNILNTVIKYISAIMEVKSSMGVIVAAPTAGSCGCFPGTIIGVAHSLGLSHDEITKAILVGGLIGVFISEGATFSAEVCGCQVECGAGSAMAAAALVQLLDGNIYQALDAASIALQNMTGLICDPVANRVEVPCLGKNIMGGNNAIASANMALAGFDKIIPLDETITAIYDIGTKLPQEFRCTCGGLGKTKTSMDLFETLQ